MAEMKAEHWAAWMVCYWAELLVARRVRRTVELLVVPSVDLSVEVRVV
jgi:hypothetical protein